MKSKIKGRCENFDVIAEKEIQLILWGVYLAELGPEINSKTALQQQCLLSFEIFESVLLDKNFKKFVLFSEENQIIGFGISSNNLRRVREITGIVINIERYEKIFPVECKEGRMHYFPITCILKSHQNEGYLYTFGKSVISIINENQGKAAFDFAYEINAGLDEIIVHIAKELNLRPNAKITEMGRQVFVVIG